MVNILGISLGILFSSRTILDFFMQYAFETLFGGCLRIFISGFCVNDLWVFVIFPLGGIAKSILEEQEISNLMFDCSLTKDM